MLHADRRPFFHAGRDRGAARSAARRRRATAGLWEELDTDWLLLDAELLPWCAKAEDAARDQYAAVGAAAPGGAAGGRRGADGGGRARDRRRATCSRARRPRLANASGFTARVPALLLADRRARRRAAGAVPAAGAARARPTHDRPHDWHLASLDRLVAADPRVQRDPARSSSTSPTPSRCAGGVAWWEELTAAGGEGMVVKPPANLTRGARGLVQPGVKVRGREYLRIIYGPDYTEPANLERLRERGLGHKRSLALREYALGLEALERVARGEPLWRVHECVFAVLALESEPVDPRL